MTDPSSLGGEPLGTWVWLGAVMLGEIPFLGIRPMIMVSQFQDFETGPKPAMTAPAGSSFLL